MSAFLCSDAHINTLVRYASKHGVTAWYANPSRKLEVAGNEQETAALLYAENVRSVNYRYQEDSAVFPIVYDHLTPLLTPVEIIKACQCLAYQCDESPTWGRSAAKALLEALKSKAITLVPGYDEAPWGIE